MNDAYKWYQTGLMVARHITSVTTSPLFRKIIVAQRFRSLNLVFMSSLQRCVVTPTVMHHCG